MSTPQTWLSKSRFLSGCQCPLRLWNDVHRRDLAREWTEAERVRFGRGTSVGELARQRYPGGRQVGFEPWEREPALAETARLLEDPDLPAIYEAAVAHRGVFTRVDVLARNAGGWDLIEVKSSTRYDPDKHLADIAIQHWVLVNAGLEVRRAGLMLLNREYVYPGGPYDLQLLFYFEDLTEESLTLQPSLPARVEEMHGLLSEDDAPRIGIGRHCFEPFDCPYYGDCSAGVVFPENPIDHLPSLHWRRRADLEGNGIEAIEDIPPDFPLTELQERVRSVVASGRPWRAPDLGRRLAAIERPIHHMDFETFSPALPRYPGTRPYERLPFQFSVHIEHPDGDLAHCEYLHTEDTDPRPALASALIEALGGQGSIIVYTGFEAGVLRELIQRVPEREQELQSIIDRLCDLHPIVRGGYYHPEFRGSFSLKNVLPALVPGAGWDELEIAEGQTASLVYEQALDAADEDYRNQVFDNLRKYCHRDTLATVEVRRALERAAVVALGSGSPL